MTCRLLAAWWCAVSLTLGAAAAQTPSAAAPGDGYDVAFVEGASHDPAVPSPAQIVGDRLGNAVEPAAPAEILECFRRWASHPRVRLVEYAASHGGRPLVYAVITSPANHARLADIEQDLARLADPRGIAAADADALAARTPAVAWMAYAIHGDEPSGGDAAVQLAYHLIASTDEATARLLEDMIVIVDPVMNPDGRQRYVDRLRDADTLAANTDSQSLRASRPTRRGRMNHYLFDLNRDWLPAVHPETRGRIPEVRRWRPLLLVDGHEMSAQDTYLFGAAREPRNENQPAVQRKWNRLFGQTMAAAFSQRGWMYYAGEWNDDLYPGYSSSWIVYTGGVGLLYEQAHSGGDGVTLRNRSVRSYRQSVHQQLTASLACLQRMHEGRAELKADWLAARREAVAESGPYASRAWVVANDGNAGRLDRLTDLLTLQGIEFMRAAEAFRAAGIDRLGREVEREFPPGSIVVVNRQPEARLASVLLEFDRRLKGDFLAHERARIASGRGSTMYDVTAWNLPMVFDVDAIETSVAPSVRPAQPAAADTAPPPPGAYAYVLDGADDRAVVAAARLLDADIALRVARKPFRFSGHAFGRGAIVMARDDNRDPASFARALAITDDLGLRWTAVDSGWGQVDPAHAPDDFRNDDPVDLGGSEFTLLERPRVALLGEGGFGAYSYGEIWFELDRRLRVGASYLLADALAGDDLRRYNVIILPDTGSTARARTLLPELKKWVEAGGTLIAVDGAAAMLAGEGGIGSARALGDVLEHLDEYELNVVRELEAKRRTVDLDAVYARTPPPAVAYPWSQDKRERTGKEELARRNEWQAQFSPRGAILAARTDDEHWLTLGLRDYVPVLARGGTVLMAGRGVEAPIRYGVVEEAGAPATRPSARPASLAWVDLPEGRRLLLRMSGLLWPEAADRLAHSAVVTRQRVGQGQVILFAQNPTFRAMTAGTTRAFLNAVVFGPGFGAAGPIQP